MLFKDYLERLNKYAEEHPDTLELKVVEFNRGDSSHEETEFKIEVGCHYNYYTLLPLEDFDYYNQNYYDGESTCSIDSICFNA